MEAAVRCVGLSHVYIHPKGTSLGGPSSSSLSLFSDALSEAQKKQKTETLKPQTLNPKLSNPKPSPLDNITVEIPQGARVVLVGCNGAGKSTLLALIGGQMMTQEGELLVLGRRAFHDSSLASDVCCLNTWWGGDHVLDVRLEEIVVPSLRHTSCWTAASGGPIKCTCGKRFFCNAWRVEKLLQLLQVRLDWAVGFLSAGEKRRAQLVASLAEKKKLYLLDEVTGDLDLVSRGLLCRFLLAESQETGSSVIYSTHVFDGLDGWPTHLLYLKKGALCSFLPVGAVPELGEAPTAGSLFAVVQRWLVSEEDNQSLHSALADICIEHK